jgi:hypothetical protein
MTGHTPILFLAPARRLKAALPSDVCSKSSSRDTNRLFHFRRGSILPLNLSQTPSIPAIHPRPKFSNPHSKRSSITDTAPFK